MKFIKKLIKSFLFILLSILLIGSIRLDAASLIDDGKYEVPIEKHMKMGKEMFGDTVIVEKENNKYYMTFKVNDNHAVSDLKLNLGSNSVGQIVRVKGNEVFYTYTLSKENLEKDLEFSVFVNAMKFETNFSITLKLNSSTKLANNIDDLGERPAEFVPKMDISSGYFEIKKDSYYVIKPAKATLDGDNINVNVEAYFIDQEKEVPVEIKDGRFMLENIGHYVVRYIAESDKYKTSLNNNTITIVEHHINSLVNINDLAKVENLADSNILPNMTSVQAMTFNKDSEIYKIAKDKMLKISDNFEVLSVFLYDVYGNPVNPKDNIALYLKANPRFDRANITVYHLDDNNHLTKLDTSSYGRYVRVETNLTGNFIVALNGVSFVMPMWGYALILILGIIILAVIIISIIIIKKKHKKPIK